MTTERVLILGASSDLGLALISDLDAPEVLFLAHGNEGLSRLEALGPTLRGTLRPLKAELRDPQQVQAMISRLRDDGDQPTKIVHMAAPRPSMARFKDLGWASFQEHLDVQLRSAVEVLCAFAPAMAKQRGKIVVVLSSYTIGVPPAALAPYVTAKYALLGLVKGLAAEYRKSGLCVNAVSPSMMQTEFLRHLPEKIPEIGAAQHPSGRLAHPADVIPTIRFLLSSESQFITGVNIPVAGGDVF